MTDCAPYQKKNIHVKKNKICRQAGPPERPAKGFLGRRPLECHENPERQNKNSRFRSKKNFYVLVEEEKRRGHAKQQQAGGRGGSGAPHPCRREGQYDGDRIEGTARQPSASNDIRTSMIIAAALIEGVTLFAEVVCILLAFK